MLCPPLSLAFEEVFLLMRKKGLSAFEESRRALKNIFMNVTEWKKKPKIVDTRTNKGWDEEVTYKSLLQDLYLSHLEDLDDKREYQDQVDEFREWYSKLDPGVDHYLVERLILREGYATISQDEAEELRKKYFEEEPIVIKVVKVD